MLTFDKLPVVTNRSVIRRGPARRFGDEGRSPSVIVHGDQCAGSILRLVRGPHITVYGDRSFQRLTQIRKSWRALRKTRVKADQKGFCDIFGRTFLELI